MDTLLFFIFFYLLTLVREKQGQPESFIKPFLNSSHICDSLGNSIIFFLLTGL